MNDKKTFNEKGDWVKPEAEAPKEAVKSPLEIELDSKLKAETERRQAAESKLVGVQAKFDEAKTQIERETSEMRQRMMKTLEDRAKQAQFGFLITLLPVLDNLNLAVAASETDPSVDHLREGVKGRPGASNRRGKRRVEPIVRVGAKFDPELHEAVGHGPGRIEEDDGMIVTEYARGYKFGERLLRPARVQVGKSMAQSAGE